MAKQHIHNIDTLDKEIYRLKLKALRMEGQLEKRGNYFRNHALVVLLSALFPKRKAEEPPIVSIGSLLLRNEKVQEGLAKAADMAADKLAEAIEKLQQHLQKTNTAKNEEGGQSPDI